MMVQAQVVWSGVRSALEMRMRMRRRIAKCSRSCLPFTGSNDLAWGRRVGMYRTYRIANFRGTAAKTKNKLKQMIKHINAATLHAPKIISRSHRLTMAPEF